MSTTTVSFTMTVNGVAADATSAILADPTATFGVRRTDTNAVVVASGVALTHDGTGLYSYSFTDPAANLTYEYWVTYVYGGETYRLQKFSTGNPAAASTVTAAVGGLLRLSTMRKLTRLAARNAGDSTIYPTLMVDFALQRAANELIRDAHLCLRVDSQVTVADQAAYTVDPTSFRCERVDSVFLTGDNVQVNANAAYPYVDWSLYIRGGAPPAFYNGFDTARLAIVDYTDLNDYAIANPQTSQPVMIAFQNDGTYTLWPTPDQVYTVNRRWSDFFTSWHLGTPTCTFTNTSGVLSAVVVTDPSDNQGATLAAAWSDTGGGTGATATATMSNGTLASVAVGGAGGTGYSSATKLLLGGFDSADVAFNLPDDLLYEVISLGAPAFLQFTQPDALYAASAYKAFQEHVRKVAGVVGGLGVKRIIRR